jgi:hypothetical protein
MHDDRRDDHAKPHSAGDKQKYHSPVLTEYGSIEELIDGGVMGSLPVPTVPSVLLVTA